MIEAFAIVHDALPNTKLVVGGGDHPQAAGYVESLKKQHVGNSAIRALPATSMKTGFPDSSRLLQSR